jgi:hypothetical protein
MAQTIGHDQRLINVNLDTIAAAPKPIKGALFLIRYEMSIRTFFEDHVSPLPWLVVD